jgi:hypothetical protein
MKTLLLGLVIGLTLVATCVLLISMSNKIRKVNPDMQIGNWPWVMDLYAWGWLVVWLIALVMQLDKLLRF